MLWRKTVHHRIRGACWLDGDGTQRRRAGLLPTLGLPLSASFVAAGLLGLTSGLGAGFYGTLVTSAVLQLAPTGQIGRVMSAPVLLQHGRGPRHLRTHRAADRRLKCRVPFLIGGLLILLVAARLREPGTASADHRSHSPSGRATLAVSVCSTRYLQAGKEVLPMNRGIIGTIIGVLVIIILVIVILQLT